ncbi:rod shape-determining protein MreD [Alloiococcus sp. CFN-8]|uniref:rod shape-determining protein MreD n=1 Tax=Alloiococcus sp. CFN-8 TaxID=3416081 RepID=UPI003CE7A67C
MRKTILVLICIGLMILDNTIIPHMDINTYYPSLLFVFALCHSFVNDRWDALYIGVFTGLLQDIYFFQGFGVNTLVNMLVCVAAAVIGESIFREKKLIPVLATFVLAMIKYILVYIILFAIGLSMSLKGILYVALMSMLVAFFIYKPVYKMSEKNYMKKDWKFNE